MMTMSNKTVPIPSAAATTNAAVAIIFVLFKSGPTMVIMGGIFSPTTCAAVVTKGAGTCAFVKKRHP